MNHKSNPAHMLFLARFQNSGEKLLFSLSCPSVGMEQRPPCSRCYEGPPRAGPGSSEKLFGPHSKGGQAKSLHATSESLSFAGGLRLGLKGSICAIDK